jgi:hypothetical protein
MWRAILKGPDSLNRLDENCNYDELYDIPGTNCSNTLTEHRGVCLPSGLCECEEGFGGQNDWLNVNGRLDWARSEGRLERSDSKSYNCIFA